MNDRVLVEVIHGCHDAVLEFLFGCDADVARDGARELGEEAFDQVQPGAVLGREVNSKRPGRAASHAFVSLEMWAE